MLSLGIILDGEGHLSHLAPDELIEADDIEVMALDGGLVSGKPSVGIHITTKDGEHILAQTSLALFLTAADAMKARYGDPRT